jgi:alpha-tubulin suppressor-like RCC1 family protein
MLYSTKPMLVGEGYSQVECGGNHTAALNQEGQMFTWGEGALAQGDQ